MGDPAGVGPELVLKLLTEPRVLSCCTPIVIGDHTLLQRVAQKLTLPCPEPIPNELAIPAWAKPGVLDLGPTPHVQPGRVTRDTGAASYAFVDTATRLTLQGHVCALVTGPIHKEAIRLAEVPYVGHTELLTDRTGAERVCMMLTSDEITCSLVTAHVGFRSVLEELSPSRILETIELSHEAMQRMRGRPPRLTVCGLNPHAGENGLLGEREEEILIAPAIEQARRRGMQLTGPLPPDTAFTPMQRAQTDAYICMYHDQGLIPLKALAFDRAVNVTLGLPIVRTSVDHGTALDIAWQGKASVSSFVEAVILAARLATPAV